MKSLTEYTYMSKDGSLKKVYSPDNPQEIPVQVYTLYKHNLIVNFSSAYNSYFLYFSMLNKLDAKATSLGDVFANVFSGSTLTECTVSCTGYRSLRNGDGTPKPVICAEFSKQNDGTYVDIKVTYIDELKHLPATDTISVLDTSFNYIIDNLVPIVLSSD